VIITFWVDEDRVNRYQKSRIVLLNDLSSIIYQLIYVQNVKPEERLWNIQLSTDNYNDCALPLHNITSGFCKTIHNFETSMLKDLRLVHKYTPSNQNIRFKANVIRISPIYIWVLDSYSTLIVYLS
jgi:hypothetical protein